MPGNSVLVVSDTSPISSLARMGWLEWLHERWGQVLVPEAVWRELSCLRDTRALATIEAARAAGWVEVRVIAESALLHQLQESLDAGEAEAIALAHETGASWLLMDELDGRSAAAIHGLRITGTLGTILWAKVAGKIDSVRGALLELRDGIRFFVSDDLIEELAHEAGEPSKFDDLRG